MKYIGFQLAANAVSIILAVGGVIMAVRDMGNWGWMIFASLLAAAHVKWSGSDNSHD